MANADLIYRAYAQIKCTTLYISSWQSSNDAIYFLRGDIKWRLLSMKILNAAIIRRQSIGDEIDTINYST